MNDAVAKNIQIKPGDHVLVVGLGKSGLSAVRFLLQVGARVSVSEGGCLDRLGRETRRFLDGERVFVEEGGHTSELFCSVDHILLSPGVPLDLPALAAARAKGVPIFGEMALAAQFMKTPMVAVTGTNGKSTVVTLLGELFMAAGKKVFVGGNIGTPLTDYLAGNQDAEVAVLEVSSFQLDTAGNFNPAVGVILNITPDHLDRYASYADYADSKFGIVTGQDGEAAAVLNGDDPEIMSRIGQCPHDRLFLFGREIADQNGAKVAGAKVELSGLGELENYDLADTLFAESPNSENAAAAILAARLLGCTAESIVKGLASFIPLAHRLTLVAEVGGVRYLDDSKATNIGAVKSALQGIGGPVVLIAGGRDKGGDYGLLADSIRQKVKYLLLIGEAREKMAAAFADLTIIETSATLEEAVERAQQLATSGDTVLLSPACASFDMFSSYVHRGEVFAAAVKRLTPQVASGAAQFASEARHACVL
ncbi:MAG: UDP-N-acetylmuramoyl-L-alanine--D-glutamate ligase [Desulfobulbaceae bacterium]|nr:UDP-N-acetylmuramoyl-L-alanine--D-glutamate ligase [Desulfobulbaceae bacterium]